MGKMKDAFTFWGDSGDYAEEQRMNKREWSQNVVKSYPRAPRRPQRGYISLFDLSVMMGNQDYWGIEFLDADANSMTVEQTIIAVEKGKHVEMTMRNDIFKLLSFDGQNFLKELVE